MDVQLGEAARLKPLEVELKRLEDLSEAIVQDFAYMRQREEEMRDTNGKISFSFPRIQNFTNNSVYFIYRINKFQSIVFQCFQYVVFDCLGYMAGVVSSPLF